MIRNLYNPSGRQCGYFDTENKTYFKIVGKRQQFIHPKYQGMMASSRSIIKKLASWGCEKFCWTVTDWEDKPFRAIISFKDFLEKREELHFSGKVNSDPQFGVRLQHFTRIYAGQERLK